MRMLEDNGARTKSGPQKRTEENEIDILLIKPLRLLYILSRPLQLKIDIKVNTCRFTVAFYTVF